MPVRSRGQCACLSHGCLLSFARDVARDTVPRGTRVCSRSPQPARPGIMPSLCPYQDRMELLNQGLPLLPPPCNFHYQ